MVNKFYGSDPLTTFTYFWCYLHCSWSEWHNRWCYKEQQLVT